MGWKDEAVVFLTRKAWRFSAGNRHYVVLYVILFTLANIINLGWPLLVAKILNIIQEQGINRENLHTLLFYLSFFIILTIGFWIFHVPARVIEVRNAFQVRANYKRHLLEGIMALPPEWHANHHSGNTIDKIEKSTTALYDAMPSLASRRS